MSFYLTAGKRFVDIMFSICLMLVLGPVIGAIILLSAMKQGAPIFYRQVRPGINMKPFMLYKFRTMKDAKDKLGKPLPDNERLTPYGRFLRQMSLDELPELWSVLKGEMSLVGPRPLLIEYLGLYTPGQLRRHEVRPGITGWAQVNGRNAIIWKEKFIFDIWYVDHYSFLLDLRIIGITVWKILSREGINQPGQATMEKFVGTQDSELNPSG